MPERLFLLMTIPLLLAPVMAHAEDVAQAKDRERGEFALCSGVARDTCVVDGDTFWYRGSKIRVSDIDTPEVSRPDCPQERLLGERATWRFMALLNAGPFTLATRGRGEDRYGRKLRIVLRGGESLGGMLVAEGLARQWEGRRMGWCGAASAASPADRSRPSTEFRRQRPGTVAALSSFWATCLCC